MTRQAPRAPGTQRPASTQETPPRAGQGRGSSRLELPHERDQNLPATAAQPAPVMKQAARDLEQGQVDTDMRSTPGLDAQRRKQLTGRKSALRR